jgi:hypothetical protein
MRLAEVALFSFMLAACTKIGSDAPITASESAAMPDPESAEDLSKVPVEKLLDRLQQLDKQQRQFTAAIQRDVADTRHSTGTRQHESTAERESKPIHETRRSQLQELASERTLLIRELDRRCVNGTDVNGHQISCD